MQLDNMAHFLGMETPYEEALVVVFGAGFDGTTSYRPGTRFALETMRKESYGLETYSPRLDLDLEESSIREIGDLEFALGHTERVLDQIKQTSQEILQAGKLPLMVGGEHLVTLPVVEALVEQDSDFYILHFDAHTDLRDDYLGEKLSHATVLRRCHDILGDGRIFQFGIRSGTKEEFDFALKDNHTYMEPFDVKTLPDVLSKLTGKRVYITIDLDILDPSIFPGTGTPEAGGLTYKEFENTLMQVANADIKIIGADMVELSPVYDASGVSTVVACKVLRELALILANSQYI